MVDACYTIVDFGGHHGGNRLSAGIKNFQGQLIIFVQKGSSSSEKLLQEQVPEIAQLAETYELQLIIHDLLLFQYVLIRCVLHVQVWVVYTVSLQELHISHLESLSYGLSYQMSLQDEIEA